jgi:hypothetical protein
MASIGPHIPAQFLARNAVGQEPVVDAEQAEAGPSMGPNLPQSATTRTLLTLPVPRYEEEEEEEDEEVDADEYAPALPPELAATRATNPSPSGSGGGRDPQQRQAQAAPARRTIGPAARGPLPREEEEEESEEDEIGPAPPPAGRSSDARKDAVTEFMQKEEQRRQAIEVRQPRFCSASACLPVFYVPARAFSNACVCGTHLRLCPAGGRATKDSSA